MEEEVQDKCGEGKEMRKEERRRRGRSMEVYKERRAKKEVIVEEIIGK